ncbi:MAG: HTH domain-containing protein [Acidimicrobiia bacterium]|nr:HTH domain-containing protein [Acidimicrobiia bacterium]
MTSTVIYEKVTGMRADRVVSMMLLLERRGRMTARQLADELGVSRRTVMRDIDSLGEAGVPIYSTRGPGGGFHIWEGFHSQLRSLTADEAAGLSLLGNPALAGQLGLEDATRRVRLKLEQALTPELANEMAIVEQRFHHDPTPWDRAAPVKVVTFLAVSIRYRRVVRTFVDTDTEVEIRPLGLVLKAGEWFLVAEEDGERRAIAVTRLHGYRSTGSRFPYPEDFSLAAFWHEISSS